MHIVNSGMGGFLNPPNDAEHTWSVQDGYGSNAGFIALRYALTCDWITEATKIEVRRKLEDNPPVWSAEWEQQVYAYFRNCYSPDGIERNVGRCVVIKGEESKPAEWHLGFMLIREFFPSAKPNLELISSSGKWGRAA